MCFAAPLAGRGEVRVQLLKALGATSTPLAGGAASYTSDPKGGDSGRPPLNSIVRVHYHPPDRGAKSGRFGIDIPVLC